MKSWVVWLNFFGQVYSLRENSGHLDNFRLLAVFRVTNILLKISPIPQLEKPKDSQTTARTLFAPTTDFSDSFFPTIPHKTPLGRLSTLCQKCQTIHHPSNLSEPDKPDQTCKSLHPGRFLTLREYDTGCHTTNKGRWKKFLGWAHLTSCKERVGLMERR